jgi:DNA-binding MarR family transcriptional regulator
MACERVDPANLPSFRSADEILAHPRFSDARDEFVNAILGIYEHNPLLNRLLVEAGRGVLFIVIVALHARYDEDVRATWPTVRLVVKSTMAQRVSSARRLPALMSRLIETGYLELSSSPRDRRVRLLMPTAKMLAQDQDWLVAHYRPMALLFPEPGYQRIMDRDSAFHHAHRVVTADFLPLGARVMADNPIVMQFMTREAGMMILIKLIQICDPESLATPPGVTYSDIGARFGVSRTQVRKVLEDAERAGLVGLGRRRGRLVQLTPGLITAFDRFLAAGMSGHDLIYNVALRSAPA